MQNHFPAKELYRAANQKNSLFCVKTVTVLGRGTLPDDFPGGIKCLLGAYKTSPAVVEITARFCCSAGKYSHCSDG